MKISSVRTSTSLLAAVLAASALLLPAGAAFAADPAPAVASGPTAEQIAARVQNFYDSTKTFRANFTQTYTIKVHNQQKVSSGQVTFQKPGKMSFVYAAPNGNRVVSNGKTMKIYEKENGVLYETPVAKSQYPAALSFLMGQGQLTKDFTLRLLNAAEMKFEGGYVLEGTPKEATPAYQKMLLYVDGQTNQVRRVLILDAQGNRNRFDFISPTVNAKVEASEFEFTPPAGTRVQRP